MEKYLHRRKSEFCNLHLCKGLNFTGSYDMPAIHSCHIDIPESFIPFNRTLSAKSLDCGIHFFIDDYQFERVWRQPDKYLPTLRRFRCVVAPDFSIYTDAPSIVNMWNVYRNRLLAGWLQENGIQVFPSASWGGIDSFRYCFDGLPENSVIAIGHIAKGRTVSAQALWQIGVNELIRRKSPRRLLVYGNPCTIDHPDVVFIKDHLSKLKQYGRQKKVEPPQTLL